MSVMELAARFREAACRKAPHTRGNEDRELLKTMATLHRLLIESGERGREAFENLLNDPVESVRLWVAFHLLAERNAHARATLEEIANGDSPTARSARATLRMHELDGGINSPFAGS